MGGDCLLGGLRGGRFRRSRVVVGSVAGEQGCRAAGGIGCSVCACLCVGEL